MSGNNIWPQASGFQKLPKLTIFGIFNQLLSTQNVNTARFARNVEWDFFCDFQTEFSQVATISVNPSLLFNVSVAMPLFLFSLPLLAPFWLNSMHFNSFVVHTRSPAKKHIHPEGFPTIPHQPLSFRFPPFQASTKNLDVYIECTNGPLKPR